MIEAQLREEERRKRAEQLRAENEEKRRKELSQLQTISIHDFVIRKSTFTCMHSGHHTKDICAAINLISDNGNIISTKINAGYCCECKTYFILDSVYMDLRRRGIPICRISDEKTYINTGGYIGGMKLAQESLLKQYGYNVSQTEDLSELVRHKILALLIDCHVMSRNDIISYLDFFISQRRYRSQYELAISKWELDREFVENYRTGSYTTVGVNAIYR